MKIQMVIMDHQNDFLLMVKCGDKILVREVVNKDLPSQAIIKIVLGVRKSFRFCFLQDVILSLSDTDFLNLLLFTDTKFLRTWLKAQAASNNLAINYFISSKEILVWGNKKKKLEYLLSQYKTWKILISKIVNPVDFWLDKILDQSEKKLNLAIFTGKYMLAWRNFSNQWEFKLLENLSECLEFIDFKINCKLQVFNFKQNNENELEMLGLTGNLINSLEKIC